MRLGYPRSFLSLLAIGFTIAAAPLLIALLASAVAFERLAGLSEQAVQTAVDATRASRALAGATLTLERSARQFAASGEARHLDAWRANRQAWRDSLRRLGGHALTEEQRLGLAALDSQETAIARLLDAGRPAPDLGARLAAEFSGLTETARSLVRSGDQRIDEGVESLRAQAMKARDAVFWLLLAMVPTAILLSVCFTLLIARPISQVTSSIRALGEGEFARPIEIQGPGDMVHLGESLDWLRERLLTLEAQKARFLQHLSHELKTPLAALREGSDLLASGVAGNLNPEQREIARILQENSIELRKLIEGLLNYSAVHAQAAYLDASIVQLREVVKRVVNDRKLAIVAKGLRLDLNCESVTAYCDAEKVRIVLDNLLSNAVKYSPRGGLVTVKLYQEQGDAVVEVRDEGSGIPRPERDKVFQAFYRGADTPVAAVKGSGLGLSIVKEYVQLHKGSVEILDGPGAFFRIRLPRKRETEEAAA
jgi:two-component system sensor histidine kinase GlrK